MKRTTLIPGLLATWLFAGCAVQPPLVPAGVDRPAAAPTTEAAPSSAAPVTPTLTPAETPAPAVTPTPTVTVTPAPAPQPTPKATPSPPAPRTTTTPTPRTTTTSPAPKASPTAVAPRDLPGFGQTVRYRSSGVHVESLQRLLARSGYYAGKVDGSAGAGTINAILNFQRAQGIEDSGIAATYTWAALADPRPVPTWLPEACYDAGTRLCVSRAQRKLFFLVDGEVVRTFRVRLGGFTDAADGTMRVHQTSPGTYSVFRKHVNPTSRRYGEGAMPWSVMFDPMMYVHYSAGFESDGYLGASHGCVNVGSWDDAEWIYRKTPLGATVIVY